jgi:ubiquitin carboxyl-terminal hydrolase 1
LTLPNNVSLNLRFIFIVLEKKKLISLCTQDTTTLDDCLQQLTTMEYLNDVTCRKCSLIDTIQQLSTEIDSLQQTEEKLEKLTVLQQMKQDIEHRLSVGRIEEDGDDSKRIKGFISKVSRVSSKQAMFAKPPKVLCLHIARSTYLSTGEIYKNTCQIKVPELLDLSPYCTNGTLDTQPNLPISATTAGGGAKYRLMSSIVHYGSHNFGHFIAYKRRLVAEKCHCPTCSDDATVLKHHDSDWFKISDEKVDSCGIDQVLEANPYMLLYELIDDNQEDLAAAVAEEEVKIAAKLSTIVIDQAAEGEEEEEDWLTPNLPAAPPSSPLLLPHQLSSSIVSSCSSSSQPLITQPQRRRRNSSKKNLWTKTPVVTIY